MDQQQKTAGPKRTWSGRATAVLEIIVPGLPESIGIPVAVGIWLVLIVGQLLEAKLPRWALVTGLIAVVPLPCAVLLTAFLFRN